MTQDSNSNSRWGEIDIPGNRIPTREIDGDFTLIPNSMMKASITHLQFRVWCAIRMRERADGQTFPSYRQIAEDANCARSSVANCIKALIEANYLRKLSPEDGSPFASNEYLTLCSAPEGVVQLLGRGSPNAGEGVPQNLGTNNTHTKKTQEEDHGSPVEEGTSPSEPYVEPDGTTGSSGPEPSAFDYEVAGVIITNRAERHSHYTDWTALSDSKQRKQADHIRLLREHGPAGEDYKAPESKEGILETAEELQSADTSGPDFPGWEKVIQSCAKFRKHYYNIKRSLDADKSSIPNMWEVEP